MLPILIRSPLFFVHPLHAGTFSANWVEGRRQGKSQLWQDHDFLRRSVCGISPGEFYSFHTALCIAHKRLPFDLCAYHREDLTVTRSGCSTISQVINKNIINKNQLWRVFLWVSFLYTVISSPVDFWHLFWLAESNWFWYGFLLYCSKFMVV